MNVKKFIKKLPSLKLNIVENKLNLISTHISFETFSANFLFLGTRDTAATDKHINTIKLSDRNIRCIHLNRCIHIRCIRLIR